MPTDTTTARAAAAAADAMQDAQRLAYWRTQDDRQAREYAYQIEERIRVTARMVEAFAAQDAQEARP